MSKLYAENILIGSQWQTDKTLTIDSQGIITSINSGKDLEARCLSGAVLPGMVNCHSHAFQRAIAGYSEYRGNSKDSFWSWRDIMYRFVAKLTPEDVYMVARFAYLEMLKAGFTSVAEFHYLHHQLGGIHYADPAEISHQIINAANSLGIGLTHLPVLYSYAGFGEQQPAKAQQRFIHSTDTYLSLIEQLIFNYKDNDNFKLGIAPHSLRAVSEVQLKEVISLIRNFDKNAPIHIHISEQLQEVNDCVSFCGKRPVEWLLDNHQIDENWCLIHATHLTDKEIQMIVGCDAVVGLCPSTEANLGDGLFPVTDYLTIGGKFAIGSDSHITINVADELRMLEYGQRLTKYQRAVLVSEDCPSVGQYLYTQAAKNGAKAIHQNVGEISIGKRADLVVLDAEHPSLFNKSESVILDAAIFACSQLPVKDVFVAGQPIIISGRHELETKIVNHYKSLLNKII